MIDPETYILPISVRVGETGTVIRAGCPLSTLILAMERRAEYQGRQAHSLADKISAPRKQGVGRIPSECPDRQNCRDHGECIGINPSCPGRAKDEEDKP